MLETARARGWPTKYVTVESRQSAAKAAVTEEPAHHAQLLRIATIPAVFEGSRYLGGSEALAERIKFLPAQFLPAPSINHHPRARLSPRPSLRFSPRPSPSPSLRFSPRPSSAIWPLQSARPQRLSRSGSPPRSQNFKGFEEPKYGHRAYSEYGNRAYRQRRRSIYGGSKPKTTKRAKHPTGPRKTQSENRSAARQKKVGTLYYCNSKLQVQPQTETGTNLHQVQESGDSACTPQRFFSEEALKQSIQFALRSGLQRHSPRILEKRRNNALAICNAALAALTQLGLVDQLRDAAKATVILGVLSDILGFMIMRDEGHKLGQHFFALAVNNADWTFDLNKAFISCTVGDKKHAFPHVDHDVPAVLISTSHNILRSRAVRQKVRVTHCELAWINSSGQQYEWETFTTSYTRGRTRVPLFLNILRRKA